MPGSREELGFREFVLDQFQFLKDEHSFEYTSGDDYCVTYNSQHSQVRIYHERVSYEIYLVVSLKRDNCLLPSVSLTDILECAGVDDRRLEQMQASSRRAVQNAVGILAVLTRKYAQDILDGSEAAFRAVQTLRQKRTERLRKTKMMEDIERKAREAWRAENYADLISLYAPVEDVLNETQARRLEYARSRVRQTRELP